MSERLLKFLRDLALGVYRIPLDVIVALIETALRVKHACNPLTYSRARRIVRIIAGDQRGETGRHAIFLTIERARLPGFVRRGIEAYARAGCAITLVVNGEPSESFLQFVRPLVHQIIVRKNVGRDFGGYKDAVLTLFDQEARGEIAIQRLVIANDSVYYFGRGLDEMARWLVDNDSDFSGATESDEFTYHLQSFILSFSEAVVHSPAFRRYWRTYLPMGSRQWTIQRGELGLSRALIKARFAPGVLYTAHALKARLDALEPEEALDCVRLTPIAFRRKLAREERKEGDKSVDAADAGLEAYARWFAGLSAIAGEAAPGLRAEAPQAVENYMAFGDKALASARRRGRLASDALTRRMVENVHDGSQAHLGALLFLRELYMPFLKRDLVYREIFHAYEVLGELEALNMEDREAIAADLRLKGVSTWFGGLKRILYEGGII